MSFFQADAGNLVVGILAGYSAITNGIRRHREKQNSTLEAKIEEQVKLVLKHSRYQTSQIRPSNGSTLANIVEKNAEVVERLEEKVDNHMSDGHGGGVNFQ